MPATKAQRDDAVKKDNEVFEEKAYYNVLDVAEELKVLERRVAISLYIGALVFFGVYLAVYRDTIVFLVAILFFGTATTIIFRGESGEVRLGGILTYPLLLYYSFHNVWIIGHFFAISLLSIPIGIFLIRRRYIGQLLFYTLSLFVLPLTILSYYVVSLHIMPIPLIGDLFDAGVVVYTLLPQIYAYNLLKLTKTEMLHDMAAMVALLIAGIVFWIALFAVFL